MVEFIPTGRLGNYFFELATVIGYSLKHNLDFTAPFTTSNDFWSPIYLKHLQHSDYDPSLDRVEIWENGHEYQDIPFDESWRNKNIIIHGYRQSEKYFSEYRRELLYLFDLRWKLKPNTASIHIRRTDYLQYPDKHIPFSMDYIDKSMSYLVNNHGVEKFELYSDDPTWCLENLSHLPNTNIFEMGDELNDLVEISCCSSHINSSSTYSWWGAWLGKNEDKVVITPELWFVPTHPLETKDIIPNNWLKM